MTRRILTILSALFVCLLTATQSCTGCEPSTPPTSDPTGSSGMPAKMSGPGRVEAVRTVIDGAHRVRKPATRGLRARSNSITQPLNSDGGRLSISIAQSGASFDQLYFALGPLVQAQDSTNDAGETITTEVLTDPAVIKRINADDTETDLLSFTDPDDQEQFHTYNRFTITLDGEQYIEQRSLQLQTETDDLGNVYLASNASRTIHKVTPEGMRSDWLTLDAPPSDLRFNAGTFIISILPQVSDDLSTLIAPPKVVAYDTNATLIGTIATLPADIERYRGNTKRFDAPVPFRSPLSLVFSLTFHASGNIFVSSSYEGLIYNIGADGGITEHASGLYGISSITDSPLTDSLYAILPAEFETVEDLDAGTVQNRYKEYPRLMGILPDGGVQKLYDFAEYALVDIERAKNGFVMNQGNRQIGIAMLQTIAASTDILVYADPVLNKISTITITESLDGGISDASQ